VENRPELLFDANHVVRRPDHVRKRFQDSEGVDRFLRPVANVDATRHLFGDGPRLRKNGAQIQQAVVLFEEGERLRSARRYGGSFRYAMEPRRS
jgi:hypothetical protein